MYENKTLQTYGFYENICFENYYVVPGVYKLEISKRKGSLNYLVGYLTCELYTM